MSVLKSLSTALINTFDTVGDVAGAAQKTVGMATNYIDRQATAVDLTGLQQIALTVTKELEAIQAELDGNAKRQALFDSVLAQFKK